MWCEDMFQKGQKITVLFKNSYGKHNVCNEQMNNKKPAHKNIIQYQKNEWQHKHERYNKRVSACSYVTDY